MRQYGSALRVASPARTSDPGHHHRQLLVKEPMVTEYVVVPDEYARHAQLPVRPIRWCGDSSVQSLRLVNSPHVQYSLHLDCEMDLALTEPVKERKKWSHEPLLLLLRGGFCRRIKARERTGTRAGGRGFWNKVGPWDDIRFVGSRRRVVLGWRS